MHERPSVNPGGPELRDRWPTRLLIAVANLHRRMLTVYFAVLGPRLSYALTAMPARLLYRLLEPLRLRSEAQCRAACRGRIADADVAGVAEQAYVHRIWNLVDLALAQRYLQAASWHRFGGRLPEPMLARLLGAQARKQPAILMTAYYGPFDLFPVFLGFQGIRAGVVYKPHLNADFDRYRRRIRGKSGCEMIPVDQAVPRCERILAGGGSVAILADHHDERRGTPATFLGLPTRAVRSIGLLAWRHEADVAIAGIRRLDRSFRFEIIVADILDHEEWQRQPDPIAFITDRYLRGIERIVLADPTQYLWGYARWGIEMARELVSAYEEETGGAPTDSA